MKAVSGKKMCRTLAKHGWTLARVSGSHHAFQKQGNPKTIIVPVHGSKDLKPGTLHAIMRDAELTEQDIWEYEERPMKSQVMTPLTAFVIFLGAATFAADAAKRTWTFDDAVVGKLPAGFRGEVGDWAVARDGGEQVLSQSAKSPDEVFNVVLATETRAADVDLTVKLKAIAGNDDQGGGLVWRARDKDNYYVARYNPLEDNFRVYKVEKGKRTMFKNADIKATPGWHTLRVTMRGTHMACYYDGVKRLEADDDTFSESGMIGLWSKADAQSYFDDLTLMSP